MSGRSKRRHGDSPVVDVADVFADDALIDGLLSERSEPVSVGAGFGGRDAGSGAPGADPLIELFDIWREEISSTPLPPMPAVRRVPHPVATGRHRLQRTARPAMFIAAAICALLIGSAAVGSRTAKPGDSLWPLASVLWSDRLDSVRSLNEVNNALAEVQIALDAGRPDAAREALMRATVHLGHVDDLDMPESMPAKVQELWVDIIPEAERRSTLSAAAAADQTTARTAGSPVSAAAGTPMASTPLLGTILEAIIASNQPQASTDSSSNSSDGSPSPMAAAGPGTFADPGTPKAVADPPSAASIDPTTDTPAAPASPTPTPPPATTDPAPETSAAAPVDPTTVTTSSGDQKSMENSAPAPPPPSTETSSDGPGPSTKTSAPASSAPADAGSDPKAAAPR